MKIKDHAKPLAAVAFLLGGSAAAEARYASVRDGFENGNVGQWAATGDVGLRQVDAKSAVKPHSGKKFVVLTNPMPFPGTSLTGTVTLNAPKGAACSLELWVHAPGRTGALALAVRDGFATGAVVAEHKVSAPAVSKRKKANGYSAYRLNFRHTGTPFFVSIDALGPIEVAIDDFSIACRIR
ncbi:MAG TPA: hypothetical protein PKW21_00330 [Rhabdaerophilum sp.]|nr:hypothetical protein [Rhabdaerophilum sp.]